jgi:hypothetical protein
MPDLQTSLNNATGITKALYSALDQIEQYVSASQIGPDGKPSGTATYMHMAMGYPIDPKMYANPWTPGGGDSSASFSNDGTFVQPTSAPASTTTTATNGQGPAGAVYPPPKPKPDAQLENSIQNAMFTSFLVDNMLEVTQKGVAVAWPERRASIEYYTILEGIQPLQDIQPDQSVLDAVAAAQNLLYLKDDKGNFVGYTQLYAQYRRNRTAWTDAVGAQAAAYAQAMADPIAGAAWPVAAATYANKVTLALNDFNSMGRREVEDALNTLATVGQGAVKALAALARNLYDAYNIQLGGVISAGVCWSYISPISWWDHTDNSFGVQQISASSNAFAAGGNSGTSSFANNWWSEQSSSTSASLGVNFGFASASADYSHADASNAFADHSGSASWTSHTEKSANATVTFEYFVATIERPWLLGDLFNIEGWYLVGQKKNSISDGTIVSQVGDHTKLLPMIPKAFVIVRNVTITADDWGDAGSAFNSAQQDASGSGQSSSNSYGGSVGYLCISGSVSHTDQQASGAFGATSSSDGNWSFTAAGNGGTLKILGSQIVGWVGEIQPAAPKIDAPNLPSDKPAASQPAAAQPSPVPAQPAPVATQPSPVPPQPAAAPAPAQA